MYSVLAKVYDQLQEIDYGEMIAYYERIWDKFNIQPKLILDMGCGTGNITLPLAEKGYDMIGLDCSEEMLEIAAEKARAKGQDILFLKQDMSEFELYGTVDAMICALDGVNYLIEDGQVEKMLRLLHCYLEPGGLLIFDVNTLYKFREILDGQSFVYDEEGVYCVWSNAFDEGEGLCDFELNFFLENKDGSYTRRDEYQTERGYEIEALQEMIRRCGLDCVGVYDALSFDPPTETSQRVFFVVQRKKEPYMTV